MNDSQFERIARQARIKKLTEDLFRKNSFFSICEVDSLAELLGIDVEMSKDYASLKNFHCVHWHEMGKEVADEVKFRAKRILGMVDVIDVQGREVPTQEVKTFIDRIRGK